MNMFAIAMGLFFVGTPLIILSGHLRAVAMSEAAIRAKYDAEGASGEASRALMRKAGYNV